MSPFEELLEKSKAIHLKKREDYTSNPTANPHENFERANEIISWFPVEYKSYAGHIGTKLARLSSLLSSRKTPNNESLDDSFLDLVTYCALMYDQYRRLRDEPKPGTVGMFLKNAGKTKDSPDPTEPELRPCYRHLTYQKDCDVCVGQNGPSALDAGLFKEQPATPPNMCWHNLVGRDTWKCVRCGARVDKASDPYYYKPSLDSNLLTRRV